MGQKVNPHGLRLGINKEWDASWFAKKEYQEYLHEDIRIREFIIKKYEKAEVSKIQIGRPSSKKVKVTIWSAKPGILIGKAGTEVQKLKDTLKEKFKREILINIQEIKTPEVTSKLVAMNIAKQLERRIAFRKAMKNAVQRGMKMGAQGIKVLCSGRLGGSEIARSEGAHDGKVPLHTLRADIDYGFHEADTVYGKIGVKVWIYKGDII